MKDKILTDEYGFELYEENEFPQAYLLTFRTFGTWLHGDRRDSVARDGRNHYGRPRIPPNPSLETSLRNEARQHPFELSKDMRRCVELAIKDFCRRKEHLLHAVTARSNHVHSVISARRKPERLTDALKAIATRKLREEGLVDPSVIIWSRGRSRRYLWKPKNVANAIDYVLYCQSEVPFEIWQDDDFRQ
ncbi:transposase [soil metagenome]